MAAHLTVGAAAAVAGCPALVIEWLIAAGVLPAKDVGTGRRRNNYRVKPTGMICRAVIIRLAANSAHKWHGMPDVLRILHSQGVTMDPIPSPNEAEPDWPNYATVSEAAVLLSRSRQ